MLESSPFAGMNLDGIEQSLLAMAEEGATPGLLPFIYQIYNLTSQMKREVEVQKDRSQKSLDDSWEEFIKCKLGTSTFNNSAQATALRQCRIKQQECYLNSTQACASCDLLCQVMSTECAKLASFEYYNTSFCSISNPALVAGTRDHMVDLQSFFSRKATEFKNTQSSCRNATLDCNQCRATCSGTNCTDYKNQCDELQQALEGDACKALSVDSSNCSNYTICYNTKKTAWEETTSTVHKEESAFTAEYRGILRIECLLNAFIKEINENDSLKAQIQTCVANDFTGPEYLGILFIKYQNISDNPKQDCAPLVVTSNSKLPTPGSAEWIQSYYLPQPYANCSVGCCKLCGDTTYGCCSDGISPKVAADDTCTPLVLR